MKKNDVPKWGWDILGLMSCEVKNGSKSKKWSQGHCMHVERGSLASRKFYGYSMECTLVT